MPQSILGKPHLLIGVVSAGSSRLLQLQLISAGAITWSFATNEAESRFQGLYLIDSKPQIPDLQKSMAALLDPDSFREKTYHCPTDPFFWGEYDYRSLRTRIQPKINPKFFGPRSRRVHFISPRGVFFRR